MFSNQQNLVLPIFHVNESFITTFNRILHIPVEHYSNPWKDHYMTAEIKGQTIFMRVFTKQTEHLRIPNTRDSGIIVRQNSLQCVTMRYDIEVQCDPTQFTQMINLINKRIQNTTLYPDIIKNINNLIHSAAFNDIKYHIPYKTLINHEHTLDTKIDNLNQTTATVNLNNSNFINNQMITRLTAALLNQKYPKTERQFIENEIGEYVKNKVNFSSKDTEKFYTESKLVIQACKKVSGLPGKVLSDFTTLDNKLEQSLKAIQKLYS